LSKPLSFTFHRAFDCVDDPLNSLNQLIGIGVDRLLTSGGEISAEKGLPLLKQLKKQSGGKITIMPGGGINFENVTKFKSAGFSEIHISASRVIELNSSTKNNLKLVKIFKENKLTYSDFHKIKSIINIIKD
jgi:copper homeostasis protein